MEGKWNIRLKVPGDTPVSWNTRGMLVVAFAYPVVPVPSIHLSVLFDVLHLCCMHLSDGGWIRDACD